MTSQPFIGGKSKKTGLEEFNWGTPPGTEPTPSRSAPSANPMSAPGAGAFSQGYEPEEASGGGGGPDMSSMIARMQIMNQMDQTKKNFGLLTKQARYFLPRTLEQIGSQYGSQGSYWSSGRRDAQQEAAVKTRFDLKQAKSDAEYQIKGLWLQLAAQNAQEQQSRNA